MKNRTEIEVRFADIDVMGHVNNAIFLSYFEIARMDFFKKVIGGEWDWKKDGIILVRNEVDYKSPILLNDKVYIDTHVDEIGNKSMKLSYEVLAVTEEGTDRTCALGSSVLVGFDYYKGQTKAIPETWHGFLTA